MEQAKRLSIPSGFYLISAENFQPGMSSVSQPYFVSANGALSWFRKKRLQQLQERDPALFFCCPAEKNHKKADFVKKTLADQKNFLYLRMFL